MAEQNQALSAAPVSKPKSPRDRRRKREDEIAKAAHENGLRFACEAAVPRLEDKYRLAASTRFWSLIAIMFTIGFVLGRVL